MFSVAPIFALALALQAGGEVSPPAAPPDAPLATAGAEDDPIGDLVTQSMAPAPEAPAPAPPPAAPPPRAIAPPPVAPPPARASPPLAARDEDEGEEAEDPTAGLPSGPQPYSSLAPSRRVGPDSSLYTTPLVRMPARPQGALDGGWVLARTDGTQLFSFQFNDLGGEQEIEGAWRDLSREWATVASGPVMSVGYDGASVVIRFLERGRSEPSVVSLRSAGSQWTGELTTDGAPTPVVMRRN